MRGGCHNSHGGAHESCYTRSQRLYEEILIRSVRVLDTITPELVERSLVQPDDGARRNQELRVDGTTKQFGCVRIVIAAAILPALGSNCLTHATAFRSRQERGLIDHLAVAGAAHSREGKHRRGCSARSPSKHCGEQRRPDLVPHCVRREAGVCAHSTCAHAPYTHFRKRDRNTGKRDHALDEALISSRPSGRSTRYRRP